MEIYPNIHYVGVNDRTTGLFESMWSLPKGVSYNAYLINDEKVALVDTVEVCYGEELLVKIRKIIGDKPIDYLIINHMEPDHSGSIAFIKRYYPQIQIVGNKKTFEMIEGFYDITDEKPVIVDDKTTLSLGKYTLNFSLIPMVHWPETMICYDAQQQIAFTGDAFGSFGALNGAVIDTELDYQSYFSEMTRYYACILGKYGTTVQRALKKIATLGVEFKVVCSTHGPVWTKHFGEVLQHYQNLSEAKWKKGLVMVYGSMYDNTRQVAETILEGAASVGVKQIKVHNIATADSSEVLADIYTYNGLAFGGPTYNLTLFPPLDHLMHKLLGREVKNHIGLAFGGFTWASKASSVLNDYLQQIGIKTLEESIEFKQAPKQEVLTLAFEYGKSLGKAILEDENAL